MFYGFLVGLLASIGRKGYSFHKQMQMDRRIQDQIKEMHTPGNWVYQINGIYYGLNGQVLIPKREGDDIKYYFWKNGKDVYYASKRENDLNCENAKLKNRGCKFHLEYVETGGGKCKSLERVCIEDATGRMFKEIGDKSGYFGNMISYAGTIKMNKEGGQKYYLGIEYLREHKFISSDGEEWNVLVRDQIKLVPWSERDLYCVSKYM